MFKEQRPIAAQSKSWLIEAFFALLAQRPYTSITIQAISDQAQLSRRTFYRHFTSKEDLLNQYLQELFTRYTELLTTRKPQRHDETLLLFFTFWQNYRTELLLLQQQGLFERFLQRACQWYPSAYSKLNVPWHITGDQRKISYASAFGAGGYFNLLSLWLQEGFRESPRQMVTLIGSILKNLGQDH
jgi:AcrR family transcriptional regulator